MLRNDDAKYHFPPFHKLILNAQLYSLVKLTKNNRL